MEPIIGGGQPPAATGAIKDSDTAGFMADVIEASAKVPVIVDFWAPWCQPCKQLGPQLEKAVAAANGAVRLVKIDIDQNQELAQQMRIQSIPAVYAFHDGRPVDGFVGVVPESQVREFVDRMAKMGGGAQKSPVAEALERAKAALETGDNGTAAALFSQILSHVPNDPQAAAGLARCHLAAGDTGQARRLLDGLPAEVADEAEVAAARAALALAEKAAAAGGMDGPTARLAADPNDHAARFDLALALYAAGRPEDAIEALIEIIRRQRQWNDDAARKQLLEFFEALGPTHEQTVAGRRRLSSILFS